MSALQETHTIARLTDQEEHFNVWLTGSRLPPHSANILILG